jgi:hypothetical protein
MSLRRALYLLLSLMAGCTDCYAQNSNDFVNVFGGLIRSAIVQTTLTEWKKLPQNEVACVDLNLRQQGSNLQIAIQQGITPSDPRIAGARAICSSPVTQPSRLGPSFDCAKAKLPDERAICSDAELSQLDNLVVSGYNYVRSRYGTKFADAVGVPHWRARQACGSDVTCIKQRQMVAIKEYQAHGAPITSTVAVASNSGGKSIYVVDGLTLGDRVAFDSQAYREYRCVPSEQFTSFIWCQKRGQETDPRGQYISSRSILHSLDGTALYINRYLEPAWFSVNEANDDISARSKKYGAPTRIIPMPPQSNVPNGMIATWGKVVLEPLDSKNAGELAAGRDVHAGFMIDHIANFQRSAQLGLPIYRLVGGPGYVWAASWNQAGVGTLRFLAIDTSVIVSETPATNAKTESPSGPNKSEMTSIEHSVTDAEQTVVKDTEQTRIRDAEQARLRDAELKRVAQEEARSDLDYIRATRARLSDHLAMLRDSEKKRRADEISARLATANDEMSSADIKALRSEADSAVRIIEENDEFGRVADIANRRVTAINAVLEKITSDAPVIQDIQTAIRAVKLAQDDSNLRRLQDALKNLNDSYDNNRKTLQSLQFESP